jgi:hypothetical protein
MSRLTGDGEAGGDSRCVRCWSVSSLRLCWEGFGDGFMAVLVETVPSGAKRRLLFLCCVEDTPVQVA